MAMVETELGKSRRRFTAGAVALDFAAAITGGAGEVVVGVCAACSGPDSARPVLGRGLERAVG